MKRKLKDVKNQHIFKRILIVLGALFLSVSIGSGVKSAFAGQDINSLLTNWFNSKQTESINQIDEAITTEKDRLMIILKDGMETETQLANDKLTQFTKDQIEQRVSSLQAFVDELLGTMTVDTSEDKIKITDKFRCNR